jgi:uncharacterized protein
MRSLAFVVASLLVLAACSGDDDESADAHESSTTTEASSLTTSTTAADLRLEEPPGSPDRVPFGDFGEVAIAVTDADGKVVGWCVLLADTPERRQRGLMEVTDLQGYPGMLFTWTEDSSNSFYMRNTPMPLSIAWFDVDGKVVSTTDMAPCADVDNCPLYPSEGTYRYALEVPQGQLDDLGITDESTLKVGGSCAPRAGET